MDILKKLDEQGYRPYGFTDLILVEIYNKLCDIENKLGKPQEALQEANMPVDIIPLPETEKPKETPAEEKQNKVCKHCGKTHERPVDYAQCAKKKGKV